MTFNLFGRRYIYVADVLRVVLRMKDDVGFFPDARICASQWVVSHVLCLVVAEMRVQHETPRKPDLHGKAAEMVFSQSNSGRRRCVTPPGCRDVMKSSHDEILSREGIAMPGCV